MIVSLVPPRNPHSTTARDRRWIVVVAQGNIAKYHELFGTNINDPKGAKAEANRVLDHKFRWTPKGKGFQARVKEAG